MFQAGRSFFISWTESLVQREYQTLVITSILLIILFCFGNWVYFTYISGILWEKASTTTTRSSKHGASTVEEGPALHTLEVLTHFLRLDLKKLHIELTKWCDRYGPHFSCYIGSYHFHVVSDLNLMMEIMRRRPTDFRRFSRIESGLKELRLMGIFSEEGDRWKRHRRFITPSLTHGRLQDFSDTLRLISQRLMNRWKKAAETGEDFEVAKDLVRFTVDVTTQLAFEYDMDTLQKGEDVIQNHLNCIFPALSRRLVALVPYWRYFKLPCDYALDRSINQVRSEIRKIIASTSTKLETNDPMARPKTIAETLLLARDTDGTSLTSDEIIGDIFQLLLAGEDTTSSSIAWVITFMLEHPKVQKRMQEEAYQVLGSSEVVDSFETINSLRYIEAVILETMRLKPVASFIFLEPCHDLVVDKIPFKKNELAILMLGYPAMLEHNFTNPNEFCPERWIADERNPQWNHNTKAFIPFGGGARVCPGKSLALLEMQCVLAMLCRNFQVLNPVNGLQYREEMIFTTVPVNLWARLKKI